MTDSFLSFSGDFPDADESQWLEAVSKALKGGNISRIERQTADGLTIKPLYREADWAASTDPLGVPRLAPFLRGDDAVRDAFLPWDIRQPFTHPDPAQTNAEILRDIERGVSGIELYIDPTGEAGCVIADGQDLDTALASVDASIAPVALSPIGSEAGYGLESAARLATWANAQNAPQKQKLAFNLCPLSALARLGTLEESLESAFARTAALAGHLAEAFPNASLLRIDARPVHETGGSDAQELAALIADAIDTLRRLDAAGMAVDTIAPRLLFALSSDANYGAGIAKIRAARRLWARCLDALGLPSYPMKIQAVSSRRMLTKRDPWVNLLRNTAACFAGGVGGANIVTIHPFTDALGTSEELGRRTARNTQIIAQEESSLGRVADPAGGAWFMESHADALAKAAWEIFQNLEKEGGFGASLLADSFQAEIAKTRQARRKDIAKRKAPITGVSEYAQLTEMTAPVAAPTGAKMAKIGAPVSLPGAVPEAEGEDFASPLLPIRLAAPFEHLRDHADAKTIASGKRPSIFLATLGPLAEHTARADFARNLFAAGGIEAKAAQDLPEDVSALSAAFVASGCALAVLCGADMRYEGEAEAAARALKTAGAQRIYLAGKPGDHGPAWKASGIDSYIHIGVDVVATLELAHAELGMSS